MHEANNDFIKFIIWGTLLLSLLGGFILSFVMIYQRKHRLFREKEDAFKREILQAQVEVQEQTLHTISQEIHDNIGQTLSLAKLNLFTLGSEIPPAAMEKLVASQQLVAQAIKDLRSLSHGISAEFITTMGLARAIEGEVDRINNFSKTQIRLDISGSVYMLGQKREILLFRIFQEAVNNLLKHAACSEATVSILYQPGAFVMTIADNGVGFNYVQHQSSEGGFSLGLASIRRRAELLEGKIDIQSTPGKGTRLLLKIPTETSKP
ncbi:MAG: hypothetical protein KGO82_16225 [Bacteroidota bacterium]|nr:hypothetical protein [Bacteroidota bacterium]